MDLTIDTASASHQSLAAAAALPGNSPILDVLHLNHQTMGDPELRRIVLALFLDEAPRYRRTIAQAADANAWRMAVHTLKGVALNLGAFQLAASCREHEVAFAGSAPDSRKLAASRILSALDTAIVEITTLTNEPAPVGLICYVQNRP